MKQMFVPHQMMRADLSFVKSFDQAELNFILSRFVPEVTKLDNTDYPLIL